MGLVWSDEPKTTGRVIDLRSVADRIIDIRSPAEQAAAPEPDDDRAEGVALRWTLLGVRCCVELSWVGRDHDAAVDRHDVRSRT